MFSESKKALKIYLIKVTAFNKIKYGEQTFSIFGEWRNRASNRWLDRQECNITDPLSSRIHNTGWMIGWHFSGCPLSSRTQFQICLWWQNLGQAMVDDKVFETLLIQKRSQGYLIWKSLCSLGIYVRREPRSLTSDFN